MIIFLNDDNAKREARRLRVPWGGLGLRLRNRYKQKPCSDYLFRQVNFATGLKIVWTSLIHTIPTGYSPIVVMAYSLTTC